MSISGLLSRHPYAIFQWLVLHLARCLKLMHAAPSSAHPSAAAADRGQDAEAGPSSDVEMKDEGRRNEARPLFKAILREPLYPGRGEGVQSEPSNCSCEAPSITRLSGMAGLQK
jgi:hypothetical protein